MSEHREWDEHYAYFQRREELRNEHNATVRAYRDAMAETERLGKANDEACDRIAELEREAGCMDTAWQVAVKSHGEALDKIAQAGAEIAWRKQDGDTVLEVLNPIFQNSKPYTRFCRAGEHLVRGVPRLIDEYESLKAKNSELQSWRQETIDENNRLDRELDEARQALRTREARAAVDFMRAAPPVAVDPDAWKTPLDLQYSPDCCVQFHANDIGFYVTTTLRGKLCYGNMGAIPPADAASLALWLASYAAAHGCPVIASQSDILLAQIPDKDMTVGVCVTLLESTRKNLDRATRALVRAGFQDHGGEDWKPPIGPEPHWHYAGPTRAEAEALARVLREAHAKHYGGVPESYMFDGFLDEARAAFAHIGAPAPIAAEPTGWELDVTAQQIIATSKEAHDRCCETEDGINKSDWEVACAVLDLCRSRIRPTFECKECAKTKERKRPSRAELMEIIHGLGFSMIQSNMVVAITDAFLAALEGE